MVSGGFYHRWKAISGSVLALALLQLSAPAHAQSAGAAISIPSTTLDEALISLARQSGTNIVSTERALNRVRVQGISGHFSVPAALHRLLAGTGYRAIAIDARSYRIVRAREAKPPRLAPPVPSPAPPPAAPASDIIVTASKQNTTLLRYPGSIVVVDGLTPNGIAVAPRGLDDIAREMPILQNTELGTGRNKIFIRGIADSSFNGATQSTASIYFDEVPLGYSGPEPGLSLYDMDRVEIMEGPQGTLYGGGAIGGIIRLTPHPVDLSGVHAAAGAGVTATTGGAPGYDLNLMANLPVTTGSFGLRAVAYRERDGGYIDDRGRMRTNVNRTDTWGGRVTARLEPGDGWSIDLGVVGQRISARDSQYAEMGGPPLTRWSALAQPYSNRLAFLRSVVRKKWDSGLDLVSATGLVDQRSNDLFDATRLPGWIGPTAYTNQQANRLVMNETRLSRHLESGVSWVLGFSLLRDRDAQSRTIGPPNHPFEIIGVTNVTESASVFGEVTLPLSPRLSVTGGARIAVARTDSEPSYLPQSNGFVRGQTTQRLDPTLAVSWLLAPRLAAFVRLQSGYRTGGLAVARGIGRVADFESDSIEMAEIGLRKERSGPTGLDVTASISYARWNDIQADLFDRRGQPYTANIGDADIYVLEASGNWAPLPGLHADFAFMFTYNEVYGPLAQSSVRANRRLPETPPFAGNLRLSYQWEAAPGITAKIGASANYVGRSVLGTGDLLDRSQGEYAEFGASGGVRWRNIDFSLTANNLTNSSHNRFALGNPVLVARRDQTTPLRPRSVRVGVSVAW
jgi:outer membrane receptor protein involved in Fe transport